MSLCKNLPQTETFASVREQVYQNGFAFVQRLSPQACTLEVAASLGEPSQFGVEHIVQRLVPLSTSTPNTYSGNYGLERFPLHTDLAHWCVPPRYLMLRCIKGYVEVPTLVLDGNKVISAVGREILCRAVVRPRRPKATEVRLLRLLGNGPDGEILRWDKLFLKPASRIGEFAFANVRECIDSITPTMATLVEEGDTMVIDNWRMLHGRSPVLDAHRDRHLKRVYLRNLN